MIRLAIAAAALALAGSPAAAASVLAYNEASSNANPTLGATLTAADITGVDFFAGDGLEANNSTQAWVWTAWDTASTSVTDAISADDFWEWGFTTTAPSGYDLASFDIGLDRNSSGPDDFEVLLEVNDSGTFFNVLSGDFGGDGATREFNDVDLSSFTGVTSATFRLAAFNSTNGSGRFELEDILLADGTTYAFRLQATPAGAGSGDPGGGGTPGGGSGGTPGVSAVPIPAGPPLLLAALAMLWLRGRRR